MKTRTPLKAMRAMCLECCGGSSQAVAECTANEQDIAAAHGAGDETEYTACPLWPWRFGKRPQTVARIKREATREAPDGAGSLFREGAARGEVA